MMARRVDLRDEREWLNWRRSGIGGSDVAKIATGKRWGVWLDKVFNRRPDEATNVRAKRWGQIVEPGIIRFIAEENGWTTEPGGFYADGWRRASVDALIVAPVAGLIEAKKRRFARGEWNTAGGAADDGTAPVDVRAQATWYGDILRERCEDIYVGALIGGDEPAAMHVKYDAEFAGLLYDMADKFRTDYILTGHEPPADGTDACSDALRELYARTEALTLDLAPEYEDVCREYLAADAEMEAAKERRTLARQKIELAMGHANRARVGPYEIPYVAVKGRAGFDAKQHDIDQPECHQHYSKIGKPSRRFDGPFTPKTKD
jgi:predicted phage-related endonuclease